MIRFLIFFRILLYLWAHDAVAAVREQSCTLAPWEGGRRRARVMDKRMTNPQLPWRFLMLKSENYGHNSDQYRWLWLWAVHCLLHNTHARSKGEKDDMRRWLIMRQAITGNGMPIRVFFIKPASFAGGCCRQRDLQLRRSAIRDRGDRIHQRLWNLVNKLFVPSPTKPRRLQRQQRQEMIIYYITQRFCLFYLHSLLTSADQINFSIINFPAWTK